MGLCVCESLAAVTYMLRAAKKAGITCVQGEKPALGGTSHQAWLHPIALMERFSLVEQGKKYRSKSTLIEEKLSSLLIVWWVLGFPWGHLRGVPEPSTRRW